MDPLASDVPDPGLIAYMLDFLLSQVFLCHQEQESYLFVCQFRESRHDYKQFSTWAGVADAFT